MKNVKLFSVRIHNRTRSCMLMRCYEDGMWAMPTLSIPLDSDPADYLDEIMKQVVGDFEIMSAVNILEYTTEDEKYGIKTKYDSIVYDVKYKGKISPDLPTGECIYASGKWVPIDAINNKSQLDRPTTAFAMAIKVQPSLR